MRNLSVILSKVKSYLERQRAGVEHGVVELPHVELRSEGLLRALAQLQDLQLPDLVRQGLPRDRDVAVGLGLHVHLVDGGVRVEVIHDLLPRPLLQIGRAHV